MQFVDKTFENTTVELDSNQYSKCHFKNSTLIYGGSGTVSLQGCSFSNVKWEFSGSAANTLAFMQAMYTGSGIGGKKLIEDIFNLIRFSELATA